MIIGYTSGVYDLFHVGHVNLLRNAKAMCDKLVVGVTIDELVAYKGKQPVIPYHDRIEVVRSCKYVDVAIPQKDMDKASAARKNHASYLFVGDDWYETSKWQEHEKDLAAVGCKVIYFPYTEGTSSTLINETLTSLRSERK
ncbi:MULTISPECIES: adenylyltransferase/cytidyltransferase family protein [unclassified Vibrio]|uniref:adenylyltransferase/cytidyltransferase family protein n=1 Tax=unclassified Vibrio TaxID=2614977 RepID=UPI0029640F0C|nr:MULTISPECIES: adenylyltransferase/cytidyltransferase family protein [unclassified Vibrio]MDW2113403.1 adenylyltransferase/cytidyltransferase family protein [Vibrio sp. 1731]MDW3111114.1 adenylyltransferase/cytidyltransferase family protein [Vibrio sp. 1727]